MHAVPRMHGDRFVTPPIRLSSDDSMTLCNYFPLLLLHGIRPLSYRCPLHDQSLTDLQQLHFAEPGVADGPSQKLITCDSTTTTIRFYTNLEFIAVNLSHPLTAANTCSFLAKVVMKDAPAISWQSDRLSPSHRGQTLIFPPGGRCSSAFLISCAWFRCS